MRQHVLGRVHHERAEDELGLSRRREWLSFSAFIVSFLSEKQYISLLCVIEQLAAVQLGPTIIHLAFFKQHLIKEEKVDMQFKGLATAKVKLT